MKIRKLKPRGRGMGGAAIANCSSQFSEYIPLLSLPLTPSLSKFPHLRTNAENMAGWNSVADG